ncbi:dienelactone hydrolase family protein [Sphingomonas carotinifaciens]|uniref:Alpha/beta fold hydrolase n=1 Tax=Sphingomonas carotinifaciens TaxID=1166323 RepID=A0A1G7FUT4_9SPHN|nr:dienelactone hydrolase family protein [Sphingomonas carotinifaciens]MBB4086244.1 carboxymethylenebutenolidase [Sphingomonas carotinifaciens]MWC42567.1 alpha/beta fold hydrolase [Sphingomonas carotinifaciens]SDE79646.1 carboxymethylenebutenolidase [Sphingomonas carotinifaciens]
MTDLRDRAVEIYDAFTHEHHDRRTLLRQMTLLAGSATAAEALILSIAASPAAAAQIDPKDPRLVTDRSVGTEGGAPSIAYFAAPRQPKAKLGYVLVIHENRGLTPHIQDVARRLALAGFRVIAPDFLAPQGGTPADEDKARAMIGTLDYDLALKQARAFIARAATQRTGTGKVGAVGFCWGGAFVNRLAVAAGPALAAGIAYYGPAPDPAEAARVSAPLMLHYAGKDARVNATGEPWVAALKAAGKSVEAFTYPGVDHAFNNDTSAQRYDAAAAALAWDRTTRFLHARLDR